jgi:hypothetical protein
MRQSALTESAVSTQGPPLDFSGYSFNGAQFTQHIPMPQSTLPAPPPAQFSMPEMQSTLTEKQSTLDKLKKSRKRQQTSCSECHRRKQKCNKVIALRPAAYFAKLKALRTNRKCHVIGA